MPLQSVGLWVDIIPWATLRLPLADGLLPLRGVSVMTDFSGLSNRRYPQTAHSKYPLTTHSRYPRLMAFISRSAVLRTRILVNKLLR